MHSRGRGVRAMKDSGRSPLVKLFLTSYEDFKVRLRRRLGSEELANDVLKETYLRVDRMIDTQEIAQPNAYLYRMALNIAADRRQADARLLTGDEIEELLQVSDEALDPARVVGGQKELQTLLKALYELPARRRRISSPHAWRKRRTWKSPSASVFPRAWWRRKSRLRWGTAPSAWKEKSFSGSVPARENRLESRDPTFS